MNGSLSRRHFLRSGLALGASSVLPGCASFGDGPSYGVAVLGDTHYDAEPESVYHSHYDESNRHAKIQHAEFRRNGEMWRGRCRALLAASGELARQKPTDFVLQLGDLVQGDCDDAGTHRKMLGDAIALLRAAYPAELPFLTVLGNHDIRGKGARAAYLGFAEDFLGREIGKEVRYPVFAFRHGPDLWVFCDFETRNLAPVIAAVESRPEARHVFLVTHGPFTVAEDGSPAWRLGGAAACDALRPKLYEALSRRQAVVLSGHTHLTTCSRHANAFGGFAEFTFNSVWKAPELATAAALQEGPDSFGKRATGFADKSRAAFERAAPLFRGGLTDYYLSAGAGHYRLNVADAGVSVDFYPGDVTSSPKTFCLKGTLP